MVSVLPVDLIEDHIHPGLFISCNCPVIKRAACNTTPLHYFLLLKNNNFYFWRDNRVVENIYYYYCVIMILESSGCLINNQQRQTKHMSDEDKTIAVIYRTCVSTSYSHRTNPSLMITIKLSYMNESVSYFSTFIVSRRASKSGCDFLLTDAINLVGGIADKE